MDFTERVTETEQLYKGKVVTLRRDSVVLPNGAPALREVIEHPGGVAVVALDDEDALLLVSQYRHPFAGELLELPAGKLEYGEDPFACGKRELEEETGHTAELYLPLGQLLPTPAYDNEIIHLYFARGLTKTAQHLDEDEFLSVRRVPFAQAVELVLSGEICDAKTQIGILKAALLLERGELGTR